MKINRNIEIVKMIDSLKNYILNTTENLKEFTSEKELDNGMIVLEGISKNGKKYEFYYNTEIGYYRKIYDGWNNTYERELFF